MQKIKYFLISIGVIGFVYAGSLSISLGSDVATTPKQDLAPNEKIIGAAKDVDSVSQSFSVSVDMAQVDKTDTSKEVYAVIESAPIGTEDWRMEASGGLKGSSKNTGTGNPTITLSDDSLKALQGRKVRGVILAKSAINAGLEETLTKQVALKTTLSHAAVAFVQAKTASGADVTTIAIAYNSNNTATNLLVALTDSNNTITSFTDSQTNSWTTDISVLNGSASVRASIGSALNAKAGANTVTVTFSGTSNGALAIGEYSGVRTSGAIDQSNSGQNFGSAATTANITTTFADEVLVVATGRETVNGTTFTPGTNYTEQTDVGTGVRPVHYEDRIVTATGTYAGAATLVGGSENWTQVIVSYKGLAASTATTAILNVNGTVNLNGQMIIK